MGFETRLQLLWNCANAIDSSTHLQKLLKSYYRTMCRKISKNSKTVQIEKYIPSEMCPRCSSVWGETDFDLKTKPRKLKKTSKARKLITKLEEEQKSENKGQPKKILTKKQRKRAKWLEKRTTSNIQISCDLCKHKTLIALEKDTVKERRAARLKKSPELTAATQIDTTKTPKKKKRKNKQDNAGLKIARKGVERAVVGGEDGKKIIVKDESADNEKVVIQLKSKKIAESNRNKGEGIKAKLSNSVIKNEEVDKSSTSLSANLSQTLKAMKSQKKKKTPIQPTIIKKRVTPKVESKTQQKNSLLQLAALLKTQPAKTTAQNRLEMLLK